MSITKATSNVIAPILATGSTVSRSLPDRFADVVNVRDFGAKGDGTTDDTAAIQAAIASFSPYNLYNDGGAIYFPVGNYKISSTIDLTGKHGLTLYGAGVNATQVLMITGVNAPVFSSINTASSYATPWNAGCIRDMTIRGGGNSLTSAHGISADNTNGCSFRNLAIFSCYNALNIYNAFQLTLNNIDIHGGGTDRCNNGLYMGEAASIGGYYNNAVFATVISSYNCISSGFRIINGQGSKFTSCEAGNCDTGWYIGDPTTGTVQSQWVHCVNCLGDSCTTANWKIVKGSASALSQMYFVGCWSGNSPYLVYIDGASDLVFDGWLLVSGDTGVFLNNSSRVQCTNFRLIGYNRNNNSSYGFNVNSSANNNFVGSITSSFYFTGGDFLETGTSDVNFFNFYSSNTGTLLGTNSRSITNNAIFTKNAFSQTYKTLADSSSIITFANANASWSTGILSSSSANALTFNYGASAVMQMTSGAINIQPSINLRLGVAATTATKTATGKYISLVDSTGATVYIPTYS